MVTFRPETSILTAGEIQAGRGGRGRGRSSLHGINAAGLPRAACDRICQPIGLGFRLTGRDKAPSLFH